MFFNCCFLVSWTLFIYLLVLIIYNLNLNTFLYQKKDKTITWQMKVFAVKPSQVEYSQVEFYN